MFVHAENDGTMPWSQTEALCRSTVAAATEPSTDDDAWGELTPKYEVVDLGEAGTQHIWQIGAARIVKLVAKHGGKQSPSRHKEIQERGALVARFGSSRSLLQIVDVPGDPCGLPDTLRRRLPHCLLAPFVMLQTVLSPQYLLVKTKNPGAHQGH